MNDVSRLTAILTRSGLLAGVAGVALLGASAQAQVRPNMLTPPKAPARPPADDGLTGGGFYLEADQMFVDDTNHKVTAQGAVEARYKGRVLRAENVEYDQTTGIVVAHGRVIIANPDGTTDFAQDITLDKDLSEGMALGFATRLQGEVKVAAARARRQKQDVTELERVVYTPCEVCVRKIGSKPTWSIRARKVIEDRRRKTLYFQDAVIQVKGVGVIYLPAFLTADPSSPRKSGFLLPLPTVTGDRGFSFEQPYYQVISPSQDITITPQINTRVNPFLNLDWRARFYSGSVDVRAGYTYDRDFTSGGDKFGALTSRSYILASGLFQFAPTWQWGFTAQQASDKLIFQKYTIGDVFEDRGLYAADSQRLISQIYVVHQTQNLYLSVAAISVQGLRAGNALGVGADVQGTIPTVAPLIEARWEPSVDILGGRLRVGGSAVVLTQDQSPEGTGVPGVDSRRASVQADWQRTFTLSDGLRLQPFIQGRTDLYNVGNPSTTASATTTESNATVARAFGAVGVNVSYPLIKRQGDITYILEPLAQVVIAPNTRANAVIPNEDSEVWNLDETNLFSTNTSPGYDLYEGGQRINVGGRATAILSDGRSASILVGRSLAAEDQPAIPLRTGLETALSDYIIGAEATPVKGVNLFSRWRLDTNSFGINALETGANFATSHFAGYVSYLQEADAPNGISANSPTTTTTSTTAISCNSVVVLNCPSVRVKSLDTHGEIFFSRHWGVSLYAIRDLDQGAWTKRDIGLVYRDDCLRAEVIFRRDDTTNGTLGPSTSVAIRLSLATFGNSVYSHPQIVDPGY